MLIGFIDTIEVLSKSKSLRDGNVDAFIEEVLTSTSSALGCSRVNVWTFDDSRTVLTCLLSYSRHDSRFESGHSFHKSEYPNYFKFLSKNEIIVSNDAPKEDMNRELLESYLLPNSIKSMIDVPLRSEGEIIGVICFEHSKIEHRWKRQEEKFAQSIAQLLSLALETKKKKQYREELENLVEQKDLLLAEINHRVKNNISVIISLINLQKKKVRDEYHSDLLDEINNKVFSMAAVQEQLHLSEHLDKIDMEEYLHQLVNNLNYSFGSDKDVVVKWDLNPVFVDITKAIPLGLIANEIITNSFKYAFKQLKSGSILHISCEQIGPRVVLKIKDNGPGISVTTKEGMGMEIIESLCSQIDAELEYDSSEGLETKISFAV